MIALADFYILPSRELDIDLELEAAALPEPFRLSFRRWIARPWF